LNADFALRVLHADSHTLVHLVTTLVLRAKARLFGLVLAIAARNFGSHLFVDALKKETRCRQSGTTVTPGAK
jgi:hypothetical protein